MSFVNRPRFGEVKAYDDNEELKKLDMLADFYAIIRVTEALENLYSHDSIPMKMYEDSCNKLIGDYKNAEKILIREGLIKKDGSSFFSEYKVGCPYAFERLVNSGQPASVLNFGARANTSEANIGAAILETTEALITAMNAIELQQYAVDTLQPLIKNVYLNLGKISQLPPNFEGLVKMKQWLEMLHQLRANDELNEADIRQLKFDLDSTYNAFGTSLRSK